jgi:hypothetical protein
MAALAKGVELVLHVLLLLQYSRLTLGVVEEERGKAVAGPAVDDDGAEPPSYTRRADQERVDGADGDGEGIMAY